MSFRTTLLAMALTSAIIPAAFASSGSAFVGGELGFDNHAMPGNASRVDLERAASRDGSFAGGEVGYVPLPQHSYIFQDGRLVHTDSMPHNTPKPPFAMTGAERRNFQEQFVN